MWQPGELQTRMARRRALDSHPGAHRDKIALAKALRRAMTPAERLLWETLRRRALDCQVRPQHIIRGWITDFYIPSGWLVIEIDGDVHDLQPEEDQRRTQALKAEGLRVIRFDNNAVLHDLPSVITRIIDALGSVECTQTDPHSRF